MNVIEISEQLELTKLKNFNWSIFKTSGLTGEGLKEAMNWIASKCQ